MNIFNFKQWYDFSEIKNPYQISILKAISEANENIKKLAKRAKLNISKFNLNEIKQGLQIEKEHNGKMGKDTDVVKSRKDLLKIVIAHLREDPYYYTKLKKTFHEAEVPSPGKEYNLIWSTYRPPHKWVWITRGKPVVPAFTGDDPNLFNKNAVHSARKTPETETPNSGQVPTASMSTNIEYTLATVKNLNNVTKGHPVVVFQKDDIWHYQDKKGIKGTVSNEDIFNSIESIKDDNGKPIKDNNPKKLFKYFDDMAARYPEYLQGLKNSGYTVDEPKKILTALTKTVDHAGRPTPESVRIPTAKMTIYNQRIDRVFAETPKNIMINALAGTGKTTMLKHLSSYIKPGEKWLYLVFGKKNQLESENAFPSGIDVFTTHAFLGHVLKENQRVIPGFNKQLPKHYQKWKKIWRIADEILPNSWPTNSLEVTPKDDDKPSPFHYQAKTLAIKLAELAKAYALNPNDLDIEEGIEKIIETQGIIMDVSNERNIQDSDYSQEIIKAAIKLLKTTKPDANIHDYYSKYRDHEDTLWFAATYADKLNWNFGYNVVLTDEVQDFNMCQLIMIKKLKEAGARIVSVGDPNQAMYLFRGADSEAFEKLQEIIKTPPMSLPQNFRSGGNIIDYVKNNTHVKNLTYPDAMKGIGKVYAEGGTNPAVGYNNFLELVTSEIQKGGKFEEPTCMISRNNAPLAQAALHFLQNDVDFEIIGKDLSRDLDKMIKKVCQEKTKETSIIELPEKLNMYFFGLSKKWEHLASKRAEIKEIGEYTTILQGILGYLESKDYKEAENLEPMQTAEDFRTFLEKKLGGLDPDSAEDSKKIKEKDYSKTITLITAHKSKGLEWERVFVMQPGQYDPEKNEKITTPAQAEQERNTWYVALTRARKSLYVSADEGPEIKKK